MYNNLCEINLVFLYLSDLDDFNVNSFEPRLIPSFPMVIAVHKEYTIKVFLPDGKPAPDFRYAVTIHEFGEKTFLVCPIQYKGISERALLYLTCISFHITFNFINQSMYMFSYY